jgi:periplasmic divalent cation tolerance protein
MSRRRSTVGRRQYLVALVTCPNVAVGRRIAKELVRRRLAACVNLIPSLESIFWWQGKLDQAREALLVIKTTSERFERLRRAVVELHPYDVPEVLGLPVTAGHAAYLRWVTESLSPRA